MPYEPIMRWETEGGAVLQTDDDTDRGGAHTDPPDPEPTRTDEPAAENADPRRDCA
jgi:hypothetical protein